MKILWFSDAPWTSTGYGVQTRLFVPLLRALGHEVAIATKYGLQGAILHWGGCTIYPNGRDAYSQDSLPAHARHVGADLTISLCDAPPLQPHLYRGMRWVPWFPVDADPLPADCYANLRQAFQPVAFSRFGQRVAREAGLDARYVPLGVDTSVFRPTDRGEARARLGIAADRWLVGMVADNKDEHDRKAFCAQLTAFAAFRARHPDALLYLHTNGGQDGRGIDLGALCATLGLAEGRDVVFCDQYLQLVGFPERRMVDLYNALDVLLACSSWEGFGVPLVEAQACGVPVVTGAWGATEELALTGWTVAPADTEPRVHPTRGLVRQPHVGAVLDALERAYRAPPPDRDRTAGLVAPYGAASIADTHWRPLLAELGERAAAEQRVWDRMLTPGAPA